MNCPSCGAELDMGSRFAHLVVCQFCDSALIKDEKALRIAGKMAVLAQTPSPIEPWTIMNIATSVTWVTTVELCTCGIAAGWSLNGFTSVGGS